MPSRRWRRFQWRLHRLAWSSSGGRLGSRVGRLPVLELVTTGHHSGLDRSVLLTYLPSDRGPVLAGSNLGADRDPAWVRNLRANPSARVRIDGTWREVRPRFLEGDEYERAWADLVDLEAAYSLYPEMTDRHIPLVLLTGISSSG